MMTNDQVRDVADLTRRAGIRATTTKLGQGDPLLTELAPGQRRLRPVPQQAAVVAEAETKRAVPARQPRRRRPMPRGRSRAVKATETAR
jgi:hypothetical protein